MIGDGRLNFNDLTAKIVHHSRDDFDGEKAEEPNLTLPEFSRRHVGIDVLSPVGASFILWFRFVYYCSW